MLKKEELLVHLIKGTSSQVGEVFFKSLVRNLCLALEVHGAWVTEYDEPNLFLHSKAFWIDSGFVEAYDYDIRNTPCELVYKNKEYFFVPDQVIDLFPNDPDLKPYDAISYIGVPLFKEDGKTVIGHLAVLHNKPLKKSQELLDVFNIFASRAGAELLRLQHERASREGQAQLHKLVESILDAVVTLNESFHVIELNTSAKRLFSMAEQDCQDISFVQWIHPDHRDKFILMTNSIQSLPEGQQHGWVPKGLVLRNARREMIQAEASLCSYSLQGKLFFALILRNINDKVEAEEKISRLSSATHYFKQIMEEEQNATTIIGESKKVKEVMQQVSQVAPVDTTVLVYGETGTGKELFAQAIHAMSKRAGGEFIKVNCAAIPAALIESEFFGHEKGAFTGATTKRDGRFTLADGGSIFLDEVGELSLDLQAKLLRVLQEGEFEPVGSSKTRKVNVRVIAATNKDLAKMCKEGGFRTDLYYRLCVFPITLPPLRERGNDSVLIAQSFIKRFSKQFGKIIDPLSTHEEGLIRSYPWPGNIRELQNVIERSIILAQGNKIKLQVSPVVGEIIAESTTTTPARVLSSAELMELEKQNLKMAMEACQWKVSGHGSASELLGIKPTTLASKLRTMMITKK